MEFIRFCSISNLFVIKKVDLLYLVSSFKMPELPMKMPTPPGGGNNALQAPENVTKKGGKMKNEEKTAKVAEIEGNQSKHAESPEEKERTIFVSNLAYSLFQPEKKVKQLLLGCGEIEVQCVFKCQSRFEDDF